MWDPGSCPPLTGSSAVPAKARPSAATTVSQGGEVAPSPCTTKHCTVLLSLHLRKDPQHCGSRGKLVTSVLAPEGPSPPPLPAHSSGGSDDLSRFSPRLECTPRRGPTGRAPLGSAWTPAPCNVPWVALLTRAGEGKRRH